MLECSRHIAEVLKQAKHNLVHLRHHSWDTVATDLKERTSNLENKLALKQINLTKEQATAMKMKRISEVKFEPTFEFKINDLTMIKDYLN